MIKKTLPYNVDGIINYLEKNAEDELSYLESVGAEFFTTAQLIRLKGQWEVKNQLFGRCQFLLVRIAGISPVWLALWFLFDVIGWNTISIFCLSLFPVSFLIFFGGLMLMNYYFKGKGHLEFVGDLIDLELCKRGHLVA